MFNCLSQTHIAAFNIGPNVSLEIPSIIFPINQLFYFTDYKITCKKFIIMLFNELRANNLWYIGKTLMMKNFIEILPAFLQLLFGSDFLGVEIDFLKLLKFQLYSANASLVKMFVSHLSLKFVSKLR